VTGISEQLLAALNGHDVEALAALFAPDYRSEQPAHPARGFGGSAQVRKNWAAVFQAVPDFRASLVGSCVDGEIEWGEWDWSGIRTDMTPFHERGVTIIGTREGRVAWARLYMEPIEEQSDIESRVDEMTHRGTRPDR
jgi:ketosteroid isomerase-like protein